MIIEDLDSKSPFLPGIFRLEHGKRSFLNLSLVIWEGFTRIKVRICQHFLFDVIKYIKYADKRHPG